MDGTVVTWGHAQCGGDSSAVQHQLHNVQAAGPNLQADAVA